MFHKVATVFLLYVMVILAGCSSAPSGPTLEEVAKSEDTKAIASVHRTIMQLDREVMQKRELLKNLTTEIVLNPNGMTRADKKRINDLIGDYPKTLDSFISRCEAIKPPTLHNPAATTDVQSAINSANQMFRMHKSHFKAFAALNFDSMAAINTQTDQLAGEVVSHLMKAYEAIGVSPDKVDSANGGIKQ